MTTNNTNPAKAKKSTSETGHNINAANFGKAYQILTEMGTLYNPSNPSLLLTALEPKKTAIKTSIDALDNIKPVYRNAVASRENLIKPLPKLLTKVANYAKSIKISATDKENIAHQVKKLKGEKIAKKVNPDTDSNETISTAQLSFDNRIANLSTLTSQLASHPQYAPNEAEITVASLQAYHDALETSSSAVNAATYQMITARKKRNEVLYNGEESAINIIKDIKSYVLSLGEEAKPYYKALVALKFSVNKE